MIKRIYCEMPYVSYKADKTFDLELENLQTEDIIPYIKDILSGKKFKDKYGNEIELITDKEKEDFINHLKNDAIFNNIVNNKLSDEQKRELKGMLV